MRLREGAYDFMIKVSHDSTEELWNLTPPFIERHAGNPLHGRVSQEFLNVPCHFSASQVGPTDREVFADKKFVTTF